MKQSQDGHIPIPVSEARDIAAKYEKDVVIIIALDHKRAIVQTTSFGQTAQDKVIAAKLGLELTSFVGGDITRKTVYEDPAGLMGEKV